MKDFYLNDLLHLSQQQIANSKIALNMSWEGKPHRERWFETGDVSFSYSSHYGKARNFKVGQVCFGFVQTEIANRFLLVTVGKILSVPDHGACQHEDLKEYEGILGRLIVEIDKGNTYSRYVFNMSHFIDMAKVVEILPNSYEPIAFSGYDNVYLTFKQFQTILSGNRFKEYKTALSAVKGVYVLNDTLTGKLYVGSAYGENGIAQRWNCYLDTKTGGNVELIKLYREKGEDYFSKNFTFGILEFFGSNTDARRIVARESHWKKILGSKENGYNRN